MKKMQIIELFSNIKATYKSFLAIMLFVIFSIGVFSGISWTAPSLQEAVDQIFDEGHLYDIELQFPNGLTEENLQQIKALEGVDELETGYTSMQMLQHNGKDYVTKVISLTGELNTPIHVDGKIPQAAGEIALNRQWAESKQVHVGDQISFKHDAQKDDPDGMTYLKKDTYTVTAIVDSPAYISNSLSSYGFANIGSGYIQCLAFTAAESFDSSAFLGYPLAYVRSDSLRGLHTASSVYEEKVQAITDEITALGDDLAEERYGSIVKQAEDTIAEYEAKLADGKEQIQKAEKEIKEGKQSLKEGRAEYRRQEKKLNEGKAKLEAGKRKYSAAKSKYDKLHGFYQRTKQKQTKLKNGTLTYGDVMDMQDDLDAFTADPDMKDLQSKEISDFQIALDSCCNESDFKKHRKDETVSTDFRKQILKESGAALKTAEKSLKATEASLKKAKKQLDAGQKQYDKGVTQLKEGKKKLDRGEKLLKKKEKELADGKEEYAKGVKTLKSNRKKLSQIKDYDWTVLPRKYNGGVMVADKYYNLTGKLRFSMAALFIIIGLLVSYSSISRIVRDQIILIGTKKALGLRGKEITRSYLAYAGIAVFTGGILGLALGTLGVERLLTNIISKQFILDGCRPYISLLQSAGLIAAEMALIMLTAWLACRNILKQQAVELLKGEKPPTAKPRFFENWGIWNRMSLLSKTVVNNCINDKRRVLGTIIGIAGCTVLVVTSLTMNNNIQKSFRWQYEKVYSYDTVVRYNAGTKGAQSDIREVLDELGVKNTSVYASPYKLIQPGGNQEAVTVTVPFEDNFDQFVHPKQKGKTASENYEDGVWVSEAYHSHFGAEAGDKIQIMDSEGQIHVFTIQGFFEHYLLSHQIVMSQTAYQQSFDTALKPNAFLADRGTLTAKELRQALSGITAVRMVKDDYQSAHDVFSEFSDVAQAIVAVYLVLSGLMAIIVLFDLHTVFIEEKKRELIVLMINGFSLKSARQYIYRDTIVLTMIGILLGVVAGTVMGNITVLSLEPSMAYFAKGIDWSACGIGAATSAALDFILCCIALRRIAKYHLSDINKL